MRITIVISLSLLFSAFLPAQEFEWAYLIDVFEANEVAGLDVDESGNVYMCGVAEADFSLPYDGEAYVVKTDADGQPIWNVSLGADLVIGDLVCAGENVVIVAQAVGDITLNGTVVSPAATEFFMCLIVLDSSGEIVAVQQYQENHGQFANLDYDDGTVALQCRGQFNSGEFVIFFDEQGTELSYHDLDIEVSINSIAYYGGQTYLTGAAWFGQDIEIDNVFIPGGQVDGLAFVLGFDDTFTAQWGHATDAINPRDSRIVAGESGIYSYQSVLLEDFVFSSMIWKFNSGGTLLDSIMPPTFTNAVALYPDLALSDCHLVLFASNAFDNDEHEVTLFDHDLEVVDEKQITGNSNLYSGQVATHDNQIYVAHVHMDELDFNGEVMIFDPLDDAFQYPYLARIGTSSTCGLTPGVCAADISADGLVNVNDFLLLNSAYGEPCENCPEDINGSGMVDVGDFIELNSHFGGECE